MLFDEKVIKTFYGRENETINVPENRVLSDIDRRCLQDIFSHLTNSSTDCYVIKSNAHNKLSLIAGRTKVRLLFFNYLNRGAATSLVLIFFRSYFCNTKIST